ncbi:hypothetical protein KKG46_05885 [Patescibacteria group bacterium]|nr:hypothetical protein [Patescibacteria group bacterium]
MKNTAKLSLSLPFIAFLIISFSGCGSTPDPVSSDSTKTITNTTNEVRPETNNLSNYDAIYINKNLNRYTYNESIASMQEFPNAGHIDSTANSSCMDYGFSDPETVEGYGEAGIVNLKYTKVINSEVTKICYEIDYKDSPVAGDLNVITFWNISAKSAAGTQTEVGTKVNVEETTSDDTFLNAVGTLTIRNNATSVTNPLAMQIYNSANNLHCTDYGFSNKYEDTTDFDGNHKMSYLSSDNNTVCTETDYEIGAVNYILYNN